MNKKYIFGISLVLLLGFAVFVSADMTISDSYGSSFGEITIFENNIYLEKGWNLIANPGDSLEILGDSQIQEEDISAIYYFAPSLQDYIRIFPEEKEELDKLNNLENNNLAMSSTLASSVWVYSKSSGRIKYKTSSGLPSIDNLQMYSGWNFVTITPEMVEKSLNEIKGDCNIERFYFYNSGGWTEDMSSLLLDNNNILDDDWEGLGTAIKVSNDCKFVSSSNSTTSPPILPGSQKDNTNFDLQENIGDYDFRVLDFNDEAVCSDANTKEVCVRAIYSAFYTLTGDSVSDIRESNDIIFFKVTSGIDEIKSNFKEEIVENVYLKGDQIHWFYDSDKYVVVKQWGDSVKYVESPIVQYLINKYPPIAI